MKKNKYKKSDFVVVEERGYNFSSYIALYLPIPNLKLGIGKTYEEALADCINEVDLYKIKLERKNKFTQKFKESLKDRLE